MYNKASSLNLSKLNNPSALDETANRRHMVNAYFKDNPDEVTEYVHLMLENINSHPEDEISLLNLPEHAWQELVALNPQLWARYLTFRYKYQVLPDQKTLLSYPPLVQIEPSSVCNLRCVFCYQTERSFSDKKGGYMGSMSLNDFRTVVDKIEGKVDAITLASRGEPLINKNIVQMLDYISGKFVSVKINTNAHFLSPELSHAILASGVTVLVISADSADVEEFKKLRVNGSLEKVIANLEIFNAIRAEFYPDSKLIVRVSGVKYPGASDSQDMLDLWGDLVQQVAFVDYLPWENSYIAPDTGINTACSDLWRRMFVWWDLSVGVCDVDFKQQLFSKSIRDLTLLEVWNSEEYRHLRGLHIGGDRKTKTPCRSCHFS